MRPDPPAKALPRVWIVLFVAVLAAALILLFLSQADHGRRPLMAFVEDAAAGTLTVMDGERPILTYRHGNNLPAGLDPRFTRSSYIHPLYSLDGRVLTEDFPRDHFHHHGLFWAWPVVEVRGVKTSNWEPREPPLRQRFVRVIESGVSDGAHIVVENVWRLGEQEDVARETVRLTVRPESGPGRAVDIEIVLRPIGGPVTLHGAPEDNKGYSGLCFRGLAFEGPDVNVFRGGAMTTDEGPLAADSTGRTFRWADISTPDLGVAIFVSPDHPGHPLPWLIRNSYAGILNPCWPGLPGATLAADVPVSLKYRVYIHRGDCASGGVQAAYEAYIAGRGPGS